MITLDFSHLYKLKILSETLKLFSYSKPSETIAFAGRPIQQTESETPMFPEPTYTKLPFSSAINTKGSSKSIPSAKRSLNPFIFFSLVGEYVSKTMDSVAGNLLPYELIV